MHGLLKKTILEVLCLRSNLDRWISLDLPGPKVWVFFALMAKIKNFHGNVKCVVTSKSPTGPYRGVGRPAAVFVLERLVDMAAKSISMDPIRHGPHLGFSYKQRTIWERSKTNF